MQRGVAHYVPPQQAEPAVTTGNRRIEEEVGRSCKDAADDDEDVEDKEIDWDSGSHSLLEYLVCMDTGGKKAEPGNCLTLMRSGT